MTPGFNVEAFSELLRSLPRPDPDWFLSQEDMDRLRRQRAKVLAAAEGRYIHPAFERIEEHLYGVVRRYQAAKIEPISWQELRNAGTPPRWTAQAVEIEELEPLTPDGLPYIDARRYL
jgi:hypothetical protein